MHPKTGQKRTKTGSRKVEDIKISAYPLAMAWKKKEGKTCTINSTNITTKNRWTDGQTGVYLGPTSYFVQK